MHVRKLLMVLGALMTLPMAAVAQIPDNTIRIGVLSDFSGPFSDGSGRGSLVAARMAAADFAAEARGLRVQILWADHQNRPDLGAAIARRWVDEDNVAAIVDLANSGVALAVNKVMSSKNRTMLASATATSALTGSACQPTTVQWATDTWALAHAVADTLLKRGGNRWFFITVDFALGKALEHDARDAILGAGGQIAGAVDHPLNSPDFASYILQAQASTANVIALANTGHDAINAVGQIHEFQAVGNGRKLALLFADTRIIAAIGLDLAQGSIVSEPFYWDLSDGTRRWSKRFAERMSGAMPTSTQAAAYSATLAFLRAARQENSIDGRKVVARMKAGAIDDPLFGPVKIRADGRAIHRMFVFQVKAPGASRSPNDLYRLIETIGPDSAFRPMSEGGCHLPR